MSVFDNFRNDFYYHSDLPSRINPASGLPMNGSVDLAGNPFGINNQSRPLDYLSTSEDCEHQINNDSYKPSKIYSLLIKFKSVILTFLNKLFGIKTCL